MTNINGKAYAMNAITPMKPWKTPILKLFFFVLGAVKPLQNDLKNLSFIHFARWVVVRRNQFPRLSDKQPREDLRYDYLLFFSNFNGTWNQYIDAFSAVLSKGLDLIWRWSEKYPGSQAGDRIQALYHARPVRHRLLLQRLSASGDQRCQSRAARPRRARSNSRRPASRFRRPSSKRHGSNFWSACSPISAQPAWPR